MTESYGRRLASSLSGALLGNVTGFIIGVITIILVARLLGPSDYGAYTIAVSFYMLVDAAMSYGIGQYLNKYLTEYTAKGETEKAADTLLLGLLLSFALGIATMLVGIGIAYFIAGAYASSGISFTSLLIASFVILFAVPFGSETSALIGLGRPMRMAIASITENTVQLLASVALVLLGYGFNGALLGIVLGYGVGFMLGLAYLLDMLAYAKFSGISKEEAKRALSFSLPLGATNIMNTGVMQFSALLLGIYVASSVVGNYGVVTRLNTGIYAVYGAIYLAMLSGFSYINANADEGSQEKIQKTITYALILTLPLLAFLASLSGPLVFLLLSSKYRLAPAYFSIASLGLAIFLLGRLLSIAFTAKAQTTKVMLFYLITAIAQLVSLIALVPAFGGIGAVLAIFVIGGIVSSLTLGYASARSLKIRLNSRKIAAVYIANIALGLLLLAGNLLRSNLLAIVYGIFATFLLYPPLLGLLKALDKKDIESLNRFAESLHAGWARGLIEYAGKFV